MLPRLLNRLAARLSSWTQWGRPRTVAHCRLHLASDTNVGEENQLVLVFCIVCGRNGCEDAIPSQNMPCEPRRRCSQHVPSIGYVMVKRIAIDESNTAQRGCPCSRHRLASIGCHLKSTSWLNRRWRVRFKRGIGGVALHRLASSVVYQSGKFGSVVIKRCR